jgi:hypothetical protein
LLDQAWADLEALEQALHQAQADAVNAARARQCSPAGFDGFDEEADPGFWDGGTFDTP